MNSYNEFKQLSEIEQKEFVEKELKRQEKKKTVKELMQKLGWEGMTEEEYKWVENFYKVKKLRYRLTLAQIREFMLLEKTQKSIN